MSSRDLTAETLREYLSYDPETGVFTRIKSTTRPDRVGAVAGALDRQGHVQIRVLGTLHMAHRLAWLYTYGAWPTETIDHINGIKTDNRIANLRNVSQQLNNQNQIKSRGPSGYLGVSKYRDKWRAQIRLSGVSIHIGYFYTPEEAHAAYVEAKRKLHAGCTI